MSLPRIASHEEWLTARTALLEKEKALTRARDELNTERRELPMVEITKDYRFEGPDGDVGLLELRVTRACAAWSRSCAHVRSRSARDAFVGEDLRR